MAEFHFLRPWWLAALPLGLALGWWVLRRGNGASGWRSIVDPALQAYVLAEPEALGQRRWPALAAAAALLVAAVALAGPTWERLPVPAFRSAEALVVTLDLSRSMDATDVAPSRLARAKLKLLSLLERRAGGQTALVVFSTHAFTVTPLTTDSRTVTSLVGALASDIMPSRGSRIGSGVAKAAALLHQGGAGDGEILLITDSAVGPDDLDAARAARREGFRVHVLAVGTEQGAPIPSPGGGFLTDRSGRVVVPQLDRAGLRRLADAGGGRFATLAADERDLDQLFPPDAVSLAVAAEETGEPSTADVWRDAGAWLAVALLPLLALGFRRGWIAALACAALLAPPGAHAFDWESLWRRSDQRGYERLQSGEAERAAELFTTPEWRSAAQFRAERFADSAATLAGLDTAEANYNRGTALAKAGQLEPAIGALERALELDPQHEDARFNLDLLREFAAQNPPPEQDGADAAEGGDQQQGSESAAEQEGGEPGEQREASDRQGDEPQQPSEQSAQASDDPSQGDGRGEPPRQADGDDPRDAEAQNDADAPSDSERSQPVPLDVEQWASEQAAEQWLRRIPQDPGGLLRRKFLYQYQRLGIDQDGNYLWPVDESEPW